MQPLSSDLRINSNLIPPHTIANIGVDILILIFKDSINVRNFDTMLKALPLVCKEWHSVLLNNYHQLDIINHLFQKVHYPTLIKIEDNQFYRLIYNFGYKTGHLLANKISACVEPRTQIIDIPSLINYGLHHFVNDTHILLWHIDTFYIIDFNNPSSIKIKKFYGYIEQIVSFGKMVYCITSNKEIISFCIDDLKENHSTYINPLKEGKNYIYLMANDKWLVAGTMTNFDVFDVVSKRFLFTEKKKVSLQLDGDKLYWYHRPNHSSRSDIQEIDENIHYTNIHTGDSFVIARKKPGISRYTVHGTKCVYQYVKDSNSEREYISIDLDPSHSTCISSHPQLINNLGIDQLPGIYINKNIQVPTFNFTDPENNTVLHTVVLDDDSNASFSIKMHNDCIMGLNSKFQAFKTTFPSPPKIEGLSEEGAA